jgi:uncharacterized membrane protein YtjA (UPF0391 family)
LKENLTMLRLAILFLVIALIAGFFGFDAISDYSWTAGRIGFFVFLILAVLSFLGATIRRRPYGGLTERHRCWQTL